MKSRAAAHRIVVSLVVSSSLCLSAAGVRAGEKTETLVYAAYDGEDTAGQVFKTMQAAQRDTGERIESYAVVSKDLKGKVHVRDQRSRDAGVGAVLGGVVGVVGGPAGVAAGAATGGAVGYLTGVAVGIPRETVEKIRTSLTPNTSALVVVLDDKWVKDVERDMDRALVRGVIATQIARGQNPQ